MHCNHIAVLQPQLCRNIAGLGFSPFARHYSGNHYCFLFLRILRCFSSARSLFACHAFSMAGSPIRMSPDQLSSADPRSLSQLITSFFASESLGIPRVPFLTFFSMRPFAPARMLFYFNCNTYTVLRPLLPSCFYFFRYVKELSGCKAQSDYRAKGPLMSKYQQELRLKV